MLVTALSNPPGHVPVSAGLYPNLWRFATGARVPLVAGIGLLTGSQLLLLLVPWMAGRAIDVLQKGDPSLLFQAAGWVAMLLLVYAGSWALHGPGRLLERSAAVRVRQNLSEALFDKLLRAPLSWHDQHHSSDVQQRLGQATTSLSEFTQTQFVYIAGAVKFFGPLIALAVLAPITGLGAVVGYGLVAAASLRFDRVLMRLTKRQNEAERRYGAGLLDFIGNVATVVGLRLQPNVKRLLRRRLEAAFEPLRTSIGLNEAKWCLVDIVTVAITWCLVMGYVWRASGKDAGILIGGVFMVHQYAQQSASVIVLMAGNFQNFARYKVDFANADMIWRAPLQPAVQQAVPGDWAHIEVRDVCFERDLPAADDAGATRRTAGVPAPADGPRRGSLRHVNLSLRRGQRIALVGPSGSGKSTLMRVLAGLYEASNGHVAVDGVAWLGVAPLAPVATLIPQEADVFEASVLENIAFDGTPSADDLAKALHTSAFDTVLALMPEGLATPIVERGFNLSGGQRQRLCLARGVLAARDSSLLMLDEPTSALDPLTERHVFEQLDRTFPDACIVASVHRMSLLEHFDTVVLMVDGEVRDTGSVAELLARQPVFRAMVEAAPDPGTSAGAVVGQGAAGIPRSA